MNVLILGGDGMLGHSLLLELQADHSVTVTLRHGLETYECFGLFNAENAVEYVDANDPMRLLAVFSNVRPDVVINAVGIVKQRDESADIVQSIKVNALLPHRLAAICRAVGARLIHISTDCVFRGDRGSYRESDVPDATDIYGRTKLLGEVSDEGCLTLRTSIIGLELHRRRSLIEWYLQASGTIPGYTRAVFTGVTTMELGRIIRRLIESHPEISGIYHVGSKPVSKFDLLVDLTARLGRRDVQVVPDNRFVCDRSLVSERFAAAIPCPAPEWPAMLEELAGQISGRYT